VLVLYFVFVVLLLARKMTSILIVSSKKYNTMKTTLLPLLSRNAALKGFYTVCLVCVVAVTAFAQLDIKKDTITLKKWEVGIDIHQFQKDAPYNVLVKRHASKTRAWRFGLGFSGGINYKKDSVERYFAGDTTAFSTYYVHNTRNNDWSILSSIGIQYKKKLRHIDYYGATDFIIQDNINSQITTRTSFGYKDVVVPIGEVIPLIISQNVNTLHLSLTQAVGAEYALNSNFSINMELFISFRFSRINVYDKHLFWHVTNKQSIAYVSNFYFPQTTWTYSTWMNPRLLINYHF
jgi:hypothetical protein